jgi:two-component system, chemotaxis family, sensor kinase CheA
MTDVYRYFRIEAHELIDEMTAGLTGLRRGGGTAGLVAALLRHAHTLKGAARVVARTGIADRTHELETLLEPHRGSDAPVDEPALHRLFELVDGIAAELALLPAGEPVGSQPATHEPAHTPPVHEPPHALPAPERSADGGPVHPAEAATAAPGATRVPVPAQAAAPVVESGRAGAGPTSSPPGVGSPQLIERSARASLMELDALAEGISEARSQVGALRRATGRLEELRARMGDRPGPRGEDRLRKIAALEDLSRQIEGALAATLDRMDRELREVHDIAERLRLMPVTTIVPDLDRAVRDVATTQAKRVFLDVSGDALRLDVPVLTVAHDALRQIVRNAVAHGVEAPAERAAAGKPVEGRVRLDVSQRGPDVVFRVSDDGRGVDVAAVRRKLAATDPGVAARSDTQVLDALMLGGVSTAAELSEVSGRGIGLDLVRDCARRLGGSVSIRTTPGQGTTIELVTPLSLSAQEVLVVEAGDRYGFPLSAVVQSLRIGADDITRGLRGESVLHAGEAVPFVPLTAVLGDEQVSGVSHPTWSVVLIQGRAGRAAVGVRRLISGSAVAIRPLPPSAGIPPMVAGVWIDVDGVPRLVLDPERVVEAAVRRRQLGRPTPVRHAPILVVDDSLTTRMLEQSILEAAGYEVETAGSAEEALEKAAARPYSLALVDVEMPGMDGFSFVEQTRARPELRHLPCILVTTKASMADRQRGVEAGARAHIDKGEFHQGTLLSHVAELLAG